MQVCGQAHPKTHFVEEIVKVNEQIRKDQIVIDLGFFFFFFVLSHLMSKGSSKLRLLGGKSEEVFASCPEYSGVTVT